MKNPLNLVNVVYECSKIKFPFLNRFGVTFLLEISEIDVTRNAF